MRIRNSVSLIAMGVAIAGAMPAAAQTVPGAVQPPSGTNRTTGNENTRDDFGAANDVRSAVIGGGQAESSGGDIVVTGTRIVRPNSRSAAPITTVTAAEIQAQGAVNIEEVMNNLPQVQANQEQNFSQSEGRQRIKLRNLGFERTLVLVDGLRLGISNGQDVGIISPALVERIDVLSGGASSVYGSDAVSGVVNYILKKNFEGIRIDANYGFFNHHNRENAVSEAARRAGFPVPTGIANDGARLNVTLSAGANFLDDRINLSSFINYRQADLLEYGSRSHSACQVTQPIRDGALSCSLATFTAAGTIQPQSGPQAGRFLVNDPFNPGQFVGLNTGPGTRANPFDRQSFQRAFERINVGGFLTAEISDEIEFHSTAVYYRDMSANNLLAQTFNFTAFSPAVPYQVNCNNPFLSASQAQIICGAAAGTAATAPIDVRTRFDGLQGRQQEFRNEGYRITTGIRGTGFDGAWSYDLAGVVARNQNAFLGAPVPAFARLNNALQVDNVNGVATCRSVINRTDLNCVPFNAFRASADNSAAYEYLLSRTGASTGQISRMFQVVGTVSGDLGNYGITSPLSDDGVAIAVTSEFRDELFVSTANDVFRQISGGQDQRFTQNVMEANAEVNVPLVRDQSWTHLLDVNAGYRVSKYNRLSGTFDTWKIEGLWAPIQDVTFRGSYNKSQRAPTVIEADQASNLFFEQGFFADPCAPRLNPADPNGARLAPLATLEQCRNTGLPDNLYNSATLICPDDRCTVRRGGFDLTPESAFTTTFGVVVRPGFLPGLTVSVDRFLIDLRDSIGFFQANDFINGCLTTGLDYYCRGVVRNPGSGTLGSPFTGAPATGWVAVGTSNGFQSRSNGWDFQGQYNLSLAGAGRLDFGFNGTLMTSTGAQDTPEAPRRECVGFFGPLGCNESLPRWMHGFRTTWVSPDQAVNISLNWRHRSAITLSLNAPEGLGIPVNPANRRTTFANIPSYDWFDLAVSFNIAQNYSLRISANNIFDRDPPLLPDSRSVLGLLNNNTIMGYDMLGRNINIGIGVNF